MMKILVYLIVAAVGFILYVRFLEVTTAFVPARKILATPEDIGLNYEDIYFFSPDKLQLNGWLIRSDGAKTTLLFLHGNAGNIGDRIEKLLMFHQMGLNIFILEYRGYGRSEGKPSEAGFYKDAVAAFDYLQSRPDMVDQKIVLYGASLGGAVAVDLARQRAVDGLIMDSAFTSAADMSRQVVPFIPPVLLSIKFDSIGKIDQLKMPKLFLHSREDETVPFALGRKLFLAAPEPKMFVEVTGSHNDGYLQSKQIFLDGIKNFLNTFNLIGAQK